jgi:hypothetical protein
MTLELRNASALIVFCYTYILYPLYVPYSLGLALVIPYNGTINSIMTPIKKGTIINRIHVLALGFIYIK